MACSSIQRCSSALVKRNIYDVFVSFRGEDTRYNFTDNLFGAFERKCILTFRDNTYVMKGESIAPELLRAIEGSHIFVVVFSTNYAFSKWCLWELEKILECVGVSRKRVLPIFCDVDPSEVRNQRGNYAEAFAKHELEQDLKTVQRWREALKQAANLSGWDLRDKPQYAEIEKIVEEIIHILGYKFSSLPNDLVGMHYPIEELEKLLFLDSIDDVRVVGICGMGGLGKTTLATVLYGKISDHFDACCFINDISKCYRHDGPIGVQKQILHQILCEEHLQICNPYNAANLMQSRLRRVRTLIILDNVDRAEQLEKLAMNREWLGIGSRVIIISRDEHILNEYGMDAVYKVPLLNQANSLQLFCRKAFKSYNIMNNYEEVAYDILGYANGLPLAIKVLGSSLFGRGVIEWRSALDRLREIPNKDIMDVLRLSFDGLEEMEKEIFLDIACFFYNGDERYVKNILNCCGFHASIGLRVLIDKSLISIGRFVEIKMHVLLQELGKKIDQENSTKKPRKWSRLWLGEQFDNVMLENMFLPKLRALDLSGCKNLIKMRDFREFPNLERLNLEECVRLVHLDPSIGVLRKLVFLNLKDCKNLRSIPNNILGLSSLIELSLSGCSKVFNNILGLHKDLAIASCLLPSLPSFSRLRELNLNFCGLRQIPDVIGCLHWLEGLYLEGNNFVTLPSLRKLSKLVNLNLQHCMQLKSLPELPSPVLPSPVTIERDHDHPMFPCIGYWSRAGLYILNCPELGERERCSNMTFSWMIQFIQASLESPFPFRGIDIVIPIHGSEIPRWFNNHRVGNSIRMDLSPIMHDNNFIGGVCCVAFSVAREYCHREIPFIDLIFDRFSDTSSVFLDPNLVMVKSNHMWLIYLDRELLFFMLGDEGCRGDDNVNMRACIKDSSGRDLHEVQVMNCGYRWVFKEDLQMLHCEDLLAQRHKFLAIED